MAERVTPIRNVYCTDPDPKNPDWVIPHTCPCCQKCWLFVRGPKTGMCAFGGPFDGYSVCAESIEK